MSGCSRLDGRGCGDGEGVDDELDGSADFFVNLDIHELGNAGNQDAIGFEVAGGEDEGFDRLVDGAGADGLDLGVPVLADDAGDGSGNCRCTGVRGYLDHVHVYLPASMKGGDASTLIVQIILIHFKKDISIVSLS